MFMKKKPNVLVIITDQQRKTQHFDSALTDEQKAKGLTWEDLYLPSMKKLKDMGVTFNNAIIGASMCSPSRAAFMTSSYSYQNGVPNVGGNLYYASRDPGIPNLCRMMQQQGYTVHWKGKWHLGTTDGTQVTGTQNPAKPTSLDGYVNGTGDDTGSLQWNPPDAGITMGNDSTLGAGTYDNDFRYWQDGAKEQFVAQASKEDVGGDITYAPMPADGISFNPAGNANTQGMLASLDDYFAMHQDAKVHDLDTDPFCLVASFVNPHDVHVFDGGASSAGYPLDVDIQENGFLPNCFDKGNPNNPPAEHGLNIEVPPNAIHDGKKHERSFQEKPTCQQYMEEIDYDIKHGDRPPEGYRLEASSNQPIAPDQYSNGSWSDGRKFINFYAYLHQVVDRDISKLLAWFYQDEEHRELLNDTIILRHADHGEQGLSHGIREKGMICYEETIKVPMIVANPSFTPSEVDHVISLMDMVPTIADIIGLSIDDKGQLPSDVWNPNHPIYGKSFKSLIPDLNRGVAGGTLHDYGVVFCYDDVWYYQDVPSYIRCLRTADWVYAIYYNDDSYSTNPTTPVQYEMYNLADTAFGTANRNEVLQPNMLQINNLANISVSETGLTGVEVSAVEGQWRQMHYTLLKLMANESIVDTVSSLPGPTIGTDEMVNALPFGIADNQSADEGYELWIKNVTPDFTLPQ